MKSSDDYSMAYTVFGKSAKSIDAKSTKVKSESVDAKSIKVKSDKSRRFLDSDSEDFIDSMSMDQGTTFFMSPSAKSLKTRTAGAKSSKAIISNDDSSEDVAVKISGKSSKDSDSKSAKPAPRSIDPSEASKAVSYIEYSRVQAPEMAADESSGAMVYAGVSVIASVIAACVALN